MAISARETEVLNGVIGALKRELDPPRIFLFGSRAKGQSQRTSDFDLAVDLEIPDRRKQRKVREVIEKVAGLYRVDLVYMNSVEENFRNLILETGKIVYER